jgi:hypothetical protein
MGGDPTQSHQRENDGNVTAFIHGLTFLRSQIWKINQLNGMRVLSGTRIPEFH